ncbi:unnamed protein product [Oreochromis niloticus]|nr:unnamed protein product [Mustela putorius furo]
MAHQLNGLFPRSLLKAFSVLIFIILLKDVCNGQPQLIGPSQALVARAGDDVILPCHVEPAYDVSTKTLEWTRSSLDPRFVYVSRANQEIKKLKNPSFKGRTSLFVDEIKNGNISLKISKVKFDDTGTYKCYIPDLEKEAFVELVVASDAATSPVISLSGIDKDRGGVVLQCESAGWYPEPELLWLDSEGNLLSAGPTETLRGPDDLYTVSSRVTVEKRHSNNITCRVQQRNTNQNRETHIHVPEDFFEIPSSSSSVIIGLAVSLALCIMLLILSAVVLLRRKKKHKNNRSTKDHTDSGDAEVPLRKTEGKKQNTSSSSIQTEKQTSCCPLTSRRKLEEEQQRREEAEKNLQNSKEKMIKSEIEKAEFIHKLTQTLLTLESKLQLETNTEIIKQQLQQWNKTTQKLKNPLEKNPHELQLEKKTEIIKQLQEVKEASEDLKSQLENKNPEMMKSENDEIIQKLSDMLPTLESKLSESITQKTEAEKNNTEIINQLQQEKKTTEDLKKQLERKSHELSGNISQAQKEKQKMERLRNELESTKQQLQQEKKAAEDLRKQLEDRNREQQMNKLQKGDIILDEVDGLAPYICLRNTSSEDKMMTGWEIKLQINNRNPDTYKFERNFTLKAGEGLTVSLCVTRFFFQSLLLLLFTWTSVTFLLVTFTVTPIQFNQEPVS